MRPAQSQRVAVALSSCVYVCFSPWDSGKLVREGDTAEVQGVPQKVVGTARYEQGVAKSKAFQGVFSRPFQMLNAEQSAQQLLNLSSS